MNSLRFLLVHSDANQAAKIAEVLADANHSVLPTTGLEEASDALLMETFDAVLMESEFTRRGLAEFSKKLRGMTDNKQNSTRVPVIAIDGAGQQDACFDAIMPAPIDPNALTLEVTRLAHALRPARTLEETMDDAQDFAVIEAEKFEEQVGEDPELMVEIIDLFLEERKRQERELQGALESKQFDRVSRVAHTIKGSLSSLYACRARYHAQELESASKCSQEAASWILFTALKADLVELEPELLNLRLEAASA